MSSWLVTGAAGFIGYHVCRRLAGDGHDVIGIDNINHYYDPGLKNARLEQLSDLGGFHFSRVDLCDPVGLAGAFEASSPQTVVHLAAQAGVRHSLRYPMDYIQSNVVGFLNVLEECRHGRVPHLVYASSSSVYGLNSKLPFSVHDAADHPVSLYAASKRADELMAHTYSHLYGLPTTGLRFFTVYGPWGRPDMAAYKFTEAIIDDSPITVYGDGSALRDFTYIDDIVEGVVRAAQKPARANPSWSAAAPDPGSSWAPWRVFNIGHGEVVTVRRLIELLEELLGKRADVVFGAEQPGDVPVTHAETSELEDYVDFTPRVPLEEGLREFVAWITAYRG
jgi:UDP-glucuronate 4-epimerase